MSLLTAGRKTCYNRTPLHQACWGGHLELVEKLIDDYHCDPMARDDEGLTPLHIAAQRGRNNAENFLAFQKNILVNFCSNDGCIALHEAVKSGQDGCVRLLVSELKADLSIRNNKNNGCLHLAVLNGRVATAEILPQSRGYKSRTLIHQSCQYGSVQLMDLLIQKNGCDLHAEDEDGHTCLHIEAMYGHKRVVLHLINK